MPFKFNPFTGKLDVINTPFNWVTVTGASQSMAVNTGYLADNAAQITFTLPATAAVGDIIRVAGIGAGGWVIEQNAGQSIRDGSDVTATGVLGTYVGVQGDAVLLVCTTADTEFIVLSKNPDPQIVNVSKSYTAGGFDNSTAGQTTIDAMPFATETNAALAAVLGTGVARGAGVSSSSFGYTIGGQTGSSGATAVTNIQELDFVAETTAAAANSLGTAKTNGAPAWSSTRGYVLGGIVSSAASTAITYFQFSNETTGNLAATISQTQFASCPMQSSDDAYAVGGDGAITSGTVYVMNFGTETTSVLTDHFSTTIAYGAGTSSSTRGYINNGTSSTVRYFQFSDDSVGTIGDTLSQGKEYNTGTWYSVNGYYNGGDTSGAGTNITQIDRIAFATEQIDALGTGLSSARSGVSGMQS